MIRHLLLMGTLSGLAWAQTPAAAPAAAAAKAPTGPPPAPVKPALVLTLDRLLESVNRHYPSLLAALKERDIADGKLQAAQGEFDLKLKSQGLFDPKGYYTHRQYLTGLEQPTQLWGTTFTGGYRLGTGSFSSSDITKLETLSAGEWRSGVRVPLLRDGPTDRRRTDLRLAGVGQQLADLTVAQQRILVTRAASRRYWDWVAAGKRYAIARGLLELAQARAQQIKDSADAGQLAPIEVVENERLILNRQGTLVLADRILQAAAIELSLYWRNDAGEPQVPAPEQLPADFPEVASFDLKRLREDVDLALQRRPELRELEAEREQSRLEARLARNQLLPNVDVFFGYSRDVGSGRPILRPAEVETGVLLEIPLQRRKAQGKLRAEQAKIEQIDQKSRLARDRVVADIQDAYSAMQAAYERVQVARQEVQVALRLEDAERTRFELGDSTLFVVNLRELATADAAFLEVNAVADYHRFYADYLAAIAEAAR
jgi:cobalt-zinc-cadmium efflux system outer membrane protein